MSNEFIGRRGSFGLRYESTSGTESALSQFWLPKISGAILPELTKAPLGAGFNVIDDVAGHSLEMQNAALDFGAVIGNKSVGPLLLAAYGQVALCVCITLSGASGGNPARGDEISSSAGSWAGTIRKLIKIGATTYYFVEETSGTIDGQTDVTDGTWTGATSAVISGVTGHYFSRLNTNNHPSFTLYEYTPAAERKALYGMIDTLDLEFVTGDYAKATGNFKAKKDASTSSLNPSFETEEFFKGKNFGVKIGAEETDLNAASLEDIIQFSVTFAKNLNLVPRSRDTEASNVDVASIHNQSFGASGSFQAKYNSTTFRDYVYDDTLKAIRQEWINYEDTALASGIYPSLYVDWYEVNFSGFNRDSDNDSLVNQNIEIVPQYDRTNGIRTDALLINDRSTSYTS